MIVESLRSTNPDFNDLYNKTQYPMNYFYVIISFIAMPIFAIVSLFFKNLGPDAYEIMLDFTFVAFTIISFLSICLYVRIDEYQKKSPPIKKLEEKVLNFKKWWNRLAISWIIIVAFYVIPALNLEYYSGFFFNYATQNFIWIWIPLTLFFYSIIFFLYSGLMSTDLRWRLINRKLDEKSLFLEIDAYVRGLDEKCQPLHGFVVELGKYMKLETENMTEILKYGDIQRIRITREKSKN